MGKYSFDSNPHGKHIKIINLVGSNKKVLDIGCYDGGLASRLIENNCEVVGIEINADLANEAKKYCNNVICDDVENIINIPYENNYFDIILFADVLEHLKDPFSTIAKFNDYLKDDGYIIVSVPNISNWTIRFKLLFGNFEYEKDGILDETHYRFFTEKSIKQLLEDAGFHITLFDIVPVFLSSYLHKWQYLFSKIRPNLFAFQFVLIGKKEPINSL